MFEYIRPIGEHMKDRSNEQLPMNIVRIDGFKAGEGYNFMSLAEINGDEMAGVLGGLTVYDVLDQLPLDEDLKDRIYDAYEQRAESRTDVIELGSSQDIIEQREADFEGYVDDSDDFGDEHFDWPVVIQAQDGSAFRIQTVVEERIKILDKAPDDELDDNEQVKLYDTTEISLLSDDEYREYFGDDYAIDYERWRSRSDVINIIKKYEDNVPEDVDLKLEDNGEGDFVQYGDNIYTVNHVARLIMMREPYVLYIHESHFVPNGPGKNAIGHNVIISLLDENDAEHRSIGFDIEGSEEASNTYTDPEVEAKISLQDLEELMKQLIQGSGSLNTIEEILHKYQENRTELQ